MKSKIFQKAKKELPEIKINVSLKNYTTFRIGGKAKYFFIAKTKKDLILALRIAKKLKLPFYILGGGSNLLVSDKGFNGLVIRVKISKFKVQNCNIYSEVGLPLEKLTRIALQKSLTGLEWAAGIPGTVGGAIRGNAGAFGKSMKDVLKKITVFDVNRDKIVVLVNRDCRFHYRNNIFKKNPNLVIISGEIQLKKGNKKEIKKEMTGYLEHRKKVHPLNYPSAGSIFENPKKRSSEKGKVDTMIAGLLIAKCCLDGKRIGKVQISKKHSNFIINLGGGKAKDVRKLIKLAKKKVKKKFGITLKEELQHL